MAICDYRPYSDWLEWSVSNPLCLILGKPSLWSFSLLVYFSLMWVRPQYHQPLGEVRMIFRVLFTSMGVFEGFSGHCQKTTRGGGRVCQPHLQDILPLALGCQTLALWVIVCIFSTSQQLSLERHKNGSQKVTDVEKFNTKQTLSMWKTLHGI